MRIRKYPLLTAACFFSYFLFGFVDSMKGATLPIILSDMQFSYVDGANIVLGEYVGFVFATLVTGILSDALGKRFVLFIAGIFLCIGNIGYGASSSFLFSMASFVMVGIGCGAVELGGSNIISAIHGNDRAGYLNLLSCFHGVGSMLVPQFVALAISLGYGWRLSYMANAVLAVLCILMFLAAPKPPRHDEKSGNAESARRAEKPSIANALTRKIVVLDILMFCYVATEITVSTWLVDFLMNEKGLSHAKASLFLSVYFAAIMLGRFVGSFLVDRIGHMRIILISSAGAMLTLLCGILASSFLVILLPLTGLFFAVVFPTTAAVVSNEAQGNQGTLLGILFCCGGIGGMLGPWLTGVANSVLGLKYGMGINIVFCLGIAACAAWLLRDGGKEAERVRDARSFGTDS